MVKASLTLCLVAICINPVWGQTPEPPGSSSNPMATVPGSPSSQEDLDGKSEDVLPARISKIETFLAPFIYDREELRNPFQSIGSSAPLNPGEVYGPFLDVQNYTLSQFKLKGLLWRTDRPMALFEGPNGKQYRLGIKDYIGENFGYIATIREKEVVIIQTIEENQKRYSTTKVVFLNE